MARRAIRAASPPPALLEKLRLYHGLELLHQGYRQAAAEVERVGGVPICVPGCGLCCEHNAIVSYGIEAEYAVSYLLGNTRLIPRVLDAIRAWLTAPGSWTYGTKIDMDTWDTCRSEFRTATQSRCPLMDDERRCLIHEARPLVCRAYSVTRRPASDCKRPRSHLEGPGDYLYWDGHDPSIGLYDAVGQFTTNLHDPQYSRQGFLPTLIFARLKAEELAGMWYDGKVPMVKMAVGWGEGYLVLWQEQVESEAAVHGADLAIAQEVPLVERDGRLVVHYDLAKAIQ